MQKKSLLLGLFLISPILFSGCGDETEGTSLGVPAVRPVVQNSVSSALLTGSSFSLTGNILNLVDINFSPRSLSDETIVTSCDTNAADGDECSNYLDPSEEALLMRCLVKRRLFCAGPTEVLTLLDTVDGRMTEIDNRSKESTRSCLTATPVDKTSLLAFPNSETLEQHYQCLDSLSGSGGLAFGKKDSIWYVREYLSSQANRNGQVFKISSASEVEGYIGLGSGDATFSQSTVLMHLKANRDSKIFEMTMGGVGVGFCSLHLRSSADFIFIKAYPDGAGGSCMAGASNAYYEVCLNSDLTVAASATSCDALETGMELDTLGRDGPYTVGSTTFAASPANANIDLDGINSLISTEITGVGAF